MKCMKLFRYTESSYRHHLACWLPPRCSDALQLMKPVHSTPTDTQMVPLAIATQYTNAMLLGPDQKAYMVYFTVNSLKPLAIVNPFMPRLSTHGTSCYSCLARVTFAATLEHPSHNSKVSCSYNYWSVYSSWSFIGWLCVLISLPASWGHNLTSWTSILTFPSLSAAYHCHYQ